MDRGSITIHDACTWTLEDRRFPRAQDVIAFLLTGDHQHGTQTVPNDYELFSGHRLTWSVPPAP